MTMTTMMNTTNSTSTTAMNGCSGRSFLAPRMGGTLPAFSSASTASSTGSSHYPPLPFVPSLPDTVPEDSRDDDLPTKRLALRPRVAEQRSSNHQHHEQDENHKNGLHFSSLRLTDKNKRIPLSVVATTTLNNTKNKPIVPKFKLQKRPRAITMTRQLQLEQQAQQQEHHHHQHQDNLSSLTSGRPCRRLSSLFLDNLHFPDATTATATATTSAAATIVEKIPMTYSMARAGAAAGAAAGGGNDCCFGKNPNVFLPILLDDDSEDDDDDSATTTPTKATTTERSGNHPSYLTPIAVRF